MENIVKLPETFTSAGDSNLQISKLIGLPSWVHSVRVKKYKSPHDWKKIHTLRKELKLKHIDIAEIFNVTRKESEKWVTKLKNPSIFDNTTDYGSIVDSNVGIVAEATFTIDKINEEIESLAKESEQLHMKLTYIVETSNKLKEQKEKYEKILTVLND